MKTMNMIILSIMMAFAAGVLGSVQGAINSLIGRTTGQYMMIAAVSLLQVLFSGIALAAQGGSVRSFTASSILWIVASALLGVVIMFSVSSSIGTIGTLPVFVLLILGQIVISAVIDHFGLFGSPRIPVTPQKIGSVLVIAAGVAWLVKSS